jgi:hypothetical protein
MRGRTCGAEQSLAAYGAERLPVIGRTARDPKFTPATVNLSGGSASRIRLVHYLDFTASTTMEIGRGRSATRAS